MHRRFQISRVLEQKLFSFGLGPLKEYVRSEGEEGYSKKRAEAYKRGGGLLKERTQAHVILTC